MRPLMYGYLRTDLVGDQKDEWEERIRLFADREGFDLGMVFHERDGRRGAFTALIHELQRAEARHVAVPSMLHVWGSGTQNHALVSRLWNEANAGVWVADPEANRIEVKAVDRPHRGNGAQEAEDGPRACDDLASTDTASTDLASADSGSTDPVSTDQDAAPMEELRLTASPSAVTVARFKVRCILSNWQLVELQAPAERIVSELILEAAQQRVGHNARTAREADMPLVVRLRRSGCLVIEVWDTRPDPGRDPQTPVNHRVTALSARSGRRRPEFGGNLTWCELPILART